jgi:CubicO group peptidase (beta-lactamase class C family)
MVRKILITSTLIFVWIIAVIAFFILEQWLRKPSVTRGDIKSIESLLVQNLSDAAEDKRLGAAALILMHHGQIASVQTFGVGNSTTGSPPKNNETLFLLCSVSKAVSTWGILKLVEEGKITLDEPILPYLTRWRFPGSNGDYSSKVTIRHLLTHTSGLVDGFGFSGFELEDQKQTIEESLNYPQDANMGEPHAAVIVNEPGTVFSYSSAGYTILQLLIEEITHRSFNEYLQHAILVPLGMTRSNYEVEEIIASGYVDDLAPNYDLHLETQPHRKHTMMAGGSLRVTPDDFASFLTAYSRNPLLSRETILQIFQPQPGTNGSWGLGHEIYIQTDNGNYIAGHGGGAFPRTGASFWINHETGNGIALLMTGGPESINNHIDAWMYWETGKIKFDVRNVFHNRLTHALVTIVVGAGIIILMRRKKARK